MNLGTYRNVVYVNRRHLATGKIPNSLDHKDMLFYITRCKKSVKEISARLCQLLVLF